MRRELVSQLLIACLLVSVSVDADAARRSVPRSGSGGGALQQGIRNYNKGYIKKAIPLLQRAVNQSPQNEQAQLWLAKALKKQGGTANLEAAKRAFAQVVEINPNNVEALTALGEMLSWQPATRGEAIEYLQQADRLKPGEPIIVKQLAQSLYWEGRYPEALNIIEPLADRFSNDKSFMVTYASLLAKTGNPDRAVEIFETTLNIANSKDFYLKQAYAVALYQAGKNDQAKAIFEELATQIDTLPVDKQVSLKLSMGGLAYDMGLFDEAIRIDNSLPPEELANRPEIQLRIARSLAKLQRTPEAIAQFQGVFQSGRMSSAEKMEYGDYLATLDLPPENLPSPDLVETLYQSALEGAPDAGQVYVRLARYYSNQDGKADEAIRNFWQAINNTAIGNQATLQKEFLDYLKSDRIPGATADKAFQELIGQHPENSGLKEAYAEFLSYQPPRRGESIKLYLSMIQEDPSKAAALRPSLEKVLSWDKPSSEMIPLYQQAVALYPDSKEANLVLARAYNINPDTRMEALKIYQQLVTIYPEDPKIKREWAGILVGNDARRKESIALLRQLYHDNPEDKGIKIAYAKLLSYEHQFNLAMRLFEEVLAEEPDNRDALLGKGYNLMFDGQKYAALDMFRTLRTQYPEDVEVALGLAEANRAIGRYDKALKIIQEVKPLLNWAAPVWDFAPTTPSEPMINADYETPFASGFGRGPVTDFSILPYSQSRNVTPETTLSKDFPTGQGDETQSKNGGGFQKAPNKLKMGLPKRHFKRHQAEEEEMVIEDQANVPETQIPTEQSPPQTQKPEPTALPETSAATGSTIDEESQAYEVLTPPASSSTVSETVEVPPSGGYVMLGATDAPATGSAAGNDTPPSEEHQPEQIQQEEDGTAEDAEVVTTPEKTKLPSNSRFSNMKTDLEDLDNALSAIKTIQNKANTNLNQIHRNLSSSQENLPETVTVTGKPGQEGALEEEAREAESKDILKAWGQYAAIDHDTNPVLSQVGRFKTEGKNLENQIYKELRPMARVGWSYLTQDGEKTTVRLRGWSVPNQMSLSLTPQLRLRSGSSPGKYYQPRVFTSPSSTGYQTYMVGATAKYWDHVTLDGELSLLHFDQSNSVNMTYNAVSIVDFNDKVRWKLGSRRFQNPNSLLSLTGYKPFRGPFQGDLVGQVMETTIYTELNLVPIRNWDVNAGYEFAFVSGERVPTNTRNQAFFSTGYTIPYARDHAVRLGYEFLYFGYDKAATLGYFNLDSGTNQPVVKLDNVITQAPNGTVFGGYFSPEYFFLNSMRMDLRGSFMKKFIEYRLGGSMGLQTFSFGHGIYTQTPSAIASTVDGNVLFNFNDWFSGYVHGEMLKGGGAFNRFRFGGGVILRPDIPALSPVFGRI